MSNEKKLWTVVPPIRWAATLLHMDNPVLVSYSLNRANIYFSVSPIENASVSLIIMPMLCSEYVIYTL